MIQRVYSVYDSKAEVYLPPFFARADGEAIRMFTEAVRSETHEFNRFAQDFTLHHIGLFCTQTGRLEEQQPTTHLGLAQTYLDWKEMPVADLATATSDTLHVLRTALDADEEQAALTKEAAAGNEETS